MSTAYIATETTQLAIKASVQNIETALSTLKAGMQPHITLHAPTGSTVIITNADDELTPEEIDESGLWEQDVPRFGKWTVTIAKAGEIDVSQVVNVTSLTVYEITMSFVYGTITVHTPAGTALTLAGGTFPSQSKTSTGEDTFDVYEAATFTVTATRDGSTQTASVVVSARTDYDVTIKGLVRYGFRKKKSESSPSSRIEYLYDAVGKTPAGMDFVNGAFSYGDWGDLWFVTENKPLMLKGDCTVDYYLDPDDYTKKADGVTASDVSNTSYDGNAMAQFPLAYFYRYEADGYEYEIVSDGPFDANYKAYAHTRADGTIADYFYWSLFGGSGSSSKIRSLKGQTLAKSLTAAQEISGATANGTGWYTHTWSQHEYIRTLLVLMGKSTNTQAVFGNGNGHSGVEADLLTTGTLSDKGQFFGYSDTNKQVKVFHVEKFWGDQWDRIAGIINNKGPLYYKMTPEGSGYQVDNVTGYTSTGVTMGGTSGGYISATKCGEWGCVPNTLSGSETTYECDGGWYNNSQLDYPLVGGAVFNASGFSGAFSFAANSAPSDANWAFGCGLSCEMPVAA